MHIVYVLCGIGVMYIFVTCGGMYVLCVLCVCVCVCAVYEVGYVHACPQSPLQVSGEKSGCQRCPSSVHSRQGSL